MERVECSVLNHEFNVVAIRGRPIKRGVITATLTLGIYLAIVVVTTPNLPPVYALSVGGLRNWWVILGVTLGSGVQGYLVSYSKERRCNIRLKKPLTGSTGVFSALSSFLSYFALIPVGCCGTWLYIISFLPGVIGSGASAFLISDSKYLVIIGLLVMLASIFYTYHSIRSALQKRESGR